MKVIIHAGTYKTGSSAFQTLLYRNREHLLKNGVLYPKTGISSNGEAIGFRHGKFFYEHGHRSFGTLVDNLKSEILKYQPKTLVLSTEAWSRPGAYSSLFALLDALDMVDSKDVFIHFVVRNVFDYTVSHYREFVRRWGWKLDFQSYVINRFDFFDYIKLFRPYLTSNYSVHLHQYSKDTVKGLLDVTDLSSLGLPYNTKRQNQGISAVEAELCRRLNIIRGGKDHSDIPDFNELLDTFGLQTNGKIYIESLPPARFSSKFNTKYLGEFTSLTGLDSSLLDINQSVFSSKDAIEMEKIKPILDLAFFENLDLLSRMK